MMEIRLKIQKKQENKIKIMENLRLEKFKELPQMMGQVQV